MKRPSSLWPSFEATTLTSLLLLGPVSAASGAAALICDNLVVDGHKYNLQPLSGPHTVITYEYTRPTYHNTTYTIDLCAPLVRKGEVPAEERCPDGTRVCAIKHRWDPKAGKVADIDQVIPIVIEHGSDKQVTWEAQRLAADDPAQNKDAKKEGLKLTLRGGTYQQRAQRTVVELRCNPDLTGAENEWESVDEYVPPGKDKEGDGKKESQRRRRREEKDGDKDQSTPETQLKKDGAALVWEGYKREKDGDGGDMDTLYLTWYTKQACDAAVDQPVEESKHWGFFTWLVILVFLAIASYLIFGSWLNYNRYGARGWDLLPHGDTLRDIPYLMKDLIRRVLNTLQSTGSRGGYSAV
ncbi:autophagy-related protein 27 [Chaetomium strumarium]|uniref:Autophagy-related protein 27 n=1 Tax=Chaetomium strumarium TaxID=1170767 RepID=A0AAJ0GQE5_9PEZI|nr:autophagy-related protein 27 [Chaetomium strumarium]